MRIGAYILVRKPHLGRGHWKSKPGAQLNGALESHRKLAADIAQATAEFFDDIRGIPIDRRALLSKALGQRKQVTCPDLSPDQTDIFKSLVDGHKACDDAVMRLDQNGTRALIDTIGWIAGLPEDFQTILGDRFSLMAAPDDGVLTKKLRQKLTRQMRLIQRSFYRTTPFPGLAGIAMFEWTGESFTALPTPQPQPPEQTEPAAGKNHATLNVSFDPSGTPCRYLVSAGHEIEEVEISDPGPVRKAIKTMGLGYAPRPVTPGAALDRLKSLGIAMTPDILRPVAAPFSSVSVDQADVERIVARTRQADALWPHIAALSPTAHREKLRAWCEERYAGRRVSLRTVMLESNDIPRNDGELPALSKVMLNASVSGEETVTLTLPSAVAPAHPTSFTAKLMQCDAGGDLVLNGLLPGGKRQVSRYLAHPSWRDDARLDDVVNPLLIRPLMGRDFQNTPGYNADVLYIQGEPFDPSEPQVDPDDIFLEFANGAPMIMGVHGKHYQPVYFGCVREQALHPALQVLLALGDGPISEIRDRLLHTHLMLDQQLLHLGLPLPNRRPRIIANGVVVQRRRWAAAFDKLPQRRNFPSLGAWMIALHDWRTAQGIPQCASAQALSRRRYEYGQTPRAFVDFSCPASAIDLVSVLRAQPGDWLTFEELLPDPGGAQNAAEYFIEMAV